MKVLIFLGIDGSGKTIIVNHLAGSLQGDKVLKEVPVLK